MRRFWLCLAVLAAGCGGSADNHPRVAPADSGALSADGISIELPEGWTGRILIGASGRPVLHAASFPVEANDTDEGQLAQEAMGIKGMYLNIRALGPGAAPASLPLHFEASTFEPTPFEGDLRRQAAADVANGGGRFRVTAVSGGDSAPSQVDLDQLNQALASLRLTAYTPEPIAAASGNPISGFGLQASVPQGWEGGISRGQVHAGDQTIDVSINEFSGPDPSSFVTGQMPLTIGPEEFVDSQDGAGYETARSFVDAGRQFQLWVRSPDPRPPTAALERANAFLASFRAEPGDFYPGRVEPAAFARANGWQTGSGGPAEIQPDGQLATSWASTIPYRDSGDQFPPHETLAALTPDDVLVVVWLQQFGAGHAPRRGPPFSLRDFTGGGFEGVPAQNAARRLLAGTESYDATLWVFFGRSDPTEEQLDRAQAELHRLELPSWPAWNAISAER